MKQCYECKIIKHPEDFTKDSKHKSGLDTYCRDCLKIKSRDYYLRNKEEVKRKNNEFRLKYPNKVKSYKLKQSYGISLKEYNSLKKAQNNLCAICNKRPETRVTKKYRLCVDHNHATGKVRGLLCFGCNSALGYVNENKDIIKNMIKYLDLHR